MNAGGGDDASSARGMEGGVGMTRGSFTQPSRFDELIIGTQVPCTPGASQVRSGRKLVLKFKQL